MIMGRVLLILMTVQRQKWTKKMLMQLQQITYCSKSKVSVDPDENLMTRAKNTVGIHKEVGRISEF